MTSTDIERVRRKRTNLQRLEKLFDQQGKHVYDLSKRSSAGEGAPTSMMKVLRDLFRETAEALPEKNIEFDDNNDLDGLRSQINLVQSKIDAALSDLPTTADPLHPPVSVAITSTKPATPDPRVVFVVFGRNIRFRDSMFAFLRAIGLDPMEWGQVLRTAVAATPYVGDALNSAFSKATAIVVLLSGDDVARLGRAFLRPSDGPDERVLTPQARPNVLFEAGMAFGRNQSNVVMVSLGHTRSFSDITGRHILYMSNSPEARQDLAERLEHTGCAVNTKGKSDWHSSGDFEGVLTEPDGSSVTTPPLEVVRKRSNPEINAGHRPKVWVELRNNSNECLEIRILGWKKSPKGITIKYGPASMQLRIGNYWCPEKEGAEVLYVGPTNRIQLWVQPDVNPDDPTAMAALEKRCNEEGQIAYLEFRVNDAPLIIEI